MHNPRFEPDLTPLSTLPGFGEALAQELEQIDVRHLEDLTGRDPETVFVHLHLANYVAHRPTPGSALHALRMACRSANQNHH